MKHAVVMAAGEGSRLRPLSDRWPKPVLPIDGRPVIATLLRELAAAGCMFVVVVTGHLAEQVEELVGDGSGFGLGVRYVRQPGVLGSADTVRRALAAGAEPPFLVTAADTAYSAGDVRRFAEVYVGSGAAGALAVRREPPPEPPHRPAVRVVDGLVTKVIDDDPANPLGGAPLWAFGPELVPLLDGLSGPPFELADAVERAVGEGLEIAGIEIGKTRDLTHPVDLMQENFPYLDGS
jgi:NDP-sugar pyrophosphorylase family protein